jgi:hypothetical protein
MIENEMVEPRSLAYDRPSAKLLNFLSKYYGLTDFTPQNNNFVVFKDYFSSNTSNKTNTSNTSNKNTKSKKTIVEDKSMNYEKREMKDTTPYKKKIVPFNNEENELNFDFDKIDINAHSPFIEKSCEYELKTHKISDKETTSKSANKYSSNKIKLYDKVTDLEISENTEKRQSKPNYNQSNNPPWAVSDDSIKFAATSSNYGAYYALKK